MKIGVEQNDGKGEDEDGVGGVQDGHHFPVTLTISTGKDLDQPLNLLSLSGHPEVSLKLS